MIIEHTDKRRVEGVDFIEPLGFWQKEVDGVHLIFYPQLGWRKVQEVKRIDVTGECVIHKSGSIYHHEGSTMWTDGYTRSIVTRHHLPEDVDARYEASPPIDALSDFLKQFECQVIVIERDQP